MAIRKNLSPADSQTPGGTPPQDPLPPPNDTPKKQPAIPQTDIDLMTVADAVSAKWSDTPAITLLWITAAQFATKAQQYRTALTTRLALGAQQPGQSYTLAQLDKTINDAVEEVKTYIKKRYKKDGAAAQYPRYGITKDGSNWRLPRDRDERLLALATMYSTIVADGFGTEEYGETFWSDIKDQYTLAMQNSGDTDGGVSTAAGNKNVLKEEVRKVITALRHVLRGNYPDTYEEQYRAWGMQKENY